MLNGDQMLIGSLIPDATRRAWVLSYLDEVEDHGENWSELPLDLGDEVGRFERLHIAAAYALMLGGRSELITQTQTVLMRSAVDALLVALDDLGDRIEVHRSKGGLGPLHHHVLREFAAQVQETDWVFAISGACRSAAFELEDALREAVEAGADGPGQVAKIHNDLVQAVMNRFDPGTLPSGHTGLALMWVAALVGLGDMDDGNTTEHYAGV